MASGKNSFVLYTDYEEIFNELPDAEAGKLIKHIFAYVNDRNPTTDNPLITLPFIPIKQQLKRDLTKWDNYKKRQSEYGKQGGRPKKVVDNKTNKKGSLKDERVKSHNVDVYVDVDVTSSKEWKPDIQNVMALMNQEGNRQKKRLSGRTLSIESEKLIDKYPDVTLDGVHRLIKTWVKNLTNDPIGV